VKELPKMQPNPFFVKTSTLLLPWKNITNFLGYYFNFQKYCLGKENNHPRDENSPNPVTLEINNLLAEHEQKLKQLLLEFYSATVTQV
jgi:hypothetical protein